MKKILVLAVIATLCLTVVGCGDSKKEGSAAPSGGSDISNSTASDVAGAPEVTGVPDVTGAPDDTDELGTEVDWADLNTEIGVLAVRLPVVPDSYYSWKWEVSDGAIAEPLNSSTESGEYTVSFRGVEDGECRIQFQYSCANALAETRSIQIKVADAKIVEIVSAESTVVEGVRDDVLQPEIMEMFAANRIDSILSQYSTMSIISEEWQLESGEEIPTLHCVGQYRTADGVLAYNEEMEYYGLGWLYVSYQGGAAVPNVYCTYDTIKDESAVLLLDAATGDKMVQELWLNHGTQSREVIVSIEDVPEDNVRIMVTRSDNEAAGYRDEYVYFIDLDTGLISSLTHSVFDIAADVKLQVSRSNIVYGDYRTLEPLAYQNVINAADSCAVIFVVNPGQSNEYANTVFLKKYTEAGWHGAQEYVLYADAACTERLDVIDTSRDEVTVYVKNAEA